MYTYYLLVGKLGVLPTHITRLYHIASHTSTHTQPHTYQTWEYAQCYALQCARSYSQQEMNKALAFLCRVLNVQLLNIHDTEQQLPSQYTSLPIIDGSDYAMSQGIWVLSRQGTRSPWTTKALDILANVGMPCVVNITKGGYWRGDIPDASCCFDAMTQSCFRAIPNLHAYFSHPSKKATTYTEPNITELKKCNARLHLDLSDDEITYVENFYQSRTRRASDAELMMFAQANSEHCRHKIFRAHWFQNGTHCSDSLFDLIRATTTKAHYADTVISAYKDNAAVMRGSHITQLFIDKNGKYTYSRHITHTCFKAETHNHPTAIVPFEGAATGIGGEIRDEAATGRGAISKAGWCGYMVANLHLPNLVQKWEKYTPLPAFASASTIMIEAPLGGSNFGNEFGRPLLMGFFRTLETHYADCFFAYHKPIMLAGGIGTVSDYHAKKRPFHAGDLLVVLGGPNMRIGIGGGSASSAHQGANDQSHDFASVQRDNPEMQRRCQQVIDLCIALGKENPILSIHDIGAGGMANAFPELVHDANLGAKIDLDKAPIADVSLSGMELWCNESQERYAIALHKNSLLLFSQFCAKEKCPFSVIGKATTARTIQVHYAGEMLVDMPLDVLFGNLPRIQVDAITQKKYSHPSPKKKTPSNAEVLIRILACPSVASKEFLVTIADRSITGCVAGEAMVGPWQTPVADCAISLDSPLVPSGQAMALGERSALAITNPASASRIAIAEALTNLASCGEIDIPKVIFSANWMATTKTQQACGELRQAVEAASTLCQQLSIAIPVGKDSLSMQTSWQNKNRQYVSQAPVSLVISAITNVKDSRNRLTPQLCKHGDLWLIEPNFARLRLGNGALAQVTESFGGDVPDIDSHESFTDMLDFVQSVWLYLSAYHDRSDGGLWATLCEMACSSRLGLSLSLAQYAASHNTTLHPDNSSILSLLANEEIGIVVQVQPQKQHHFLEKAQSQQHVRICHIAAPLSQPIINIAADFQSQPLYSFALEDVLHQWQSVSDAISLLRDNPHTTREAIRLNRDNTQHLVQKHHQKTLQPIQARYNIQHTKPTVGILREQGSNGHKDLAMAFDAAGFDVYDINLQALNEGQTLANLQGIAACGGFSYGDVFGGGTGWAESIRENKKVLEALQTFWHRTNTFTLGICNGCQMLAQLSDCIPNMHHIPRLLPNISSKFEGRLVQVRIHNTPSVLFRDMQDMQLVVPVAHASGRFSFTQQHKEYICASYCDSQGKATLTYPWNPNGSQCAAAGITSTDGRVTLLMPHPERIYSSFQCPWMHPLSHKKQDIYTPWFRLFHNAYTFVQ